MLEQILAIIVMVVLVFGGLAGCIVKHFIHSHGIDIMNNEGGEK